MGRVMGLVGGVVAFFVASGLTSNFLQTTIRPQDAANKAKPRSVQRAIDRSNAALQEKIQSVQASVKAHTQRSQQIFGGGSKRRSSGAVTKGAIGHSGSPKQKKWKGKVVTNPYLD